MASGKGDFRMEITERKLNVPSGKDVLSEILSVCRQGFGVRVVGASGAVTACTLEQPGSDASTIVTPYTGDFLIGLLWGVFLPPIEEEESGGEIITNGLEILLYHKTNNSWRIQGIVSDRLTVARRVIVTLYAFKVDGGKLKKRLDEVGKDALLDEVMSAQPKKITIRVKATSTSNSGYAELNEKPRQWTSNWTESKIHRLKLMS